jgi:hypothetical protein
MSQRTLFQQYQGDSDPPKEVVLQPKAKPRDPDTADSIEEYCRLYWQKFGVKVGTERTLRILDEHPEWQNKVGYTNAKRLMKNALEVRR